MLTVTKHKIFKMMGRCEGKNGDKMKSRVGLNE